MKAKRNPVPTENDLCEVCGIPYAELHEVYYGTGQRQKSIEHKMQKRLCGDHHRGPNGPHMNREVDLRYKQAYQQIFEQYHVFNGMSAEGARELFRREFGRNYLD